MGKFLLCFLVGSERRELIGSANNYCLWQISSQEGTSKFIGMPVDELPVGLAAAVTPGGVGVGGQPGGQF